MRSSERPLAIDLGVHQAADEIVGGIGAARVDDRAQVPGERVGRRVPALGIEDAEVDGLRPLDELLVVVARQADDRADHLHREAGGDVGHEIGAAEGLDGVDELVDHRLDRSGAPSLDGRGAERGGDQRAVAAMLVAVHAAHGLALEHPRGLRVDRRREGVGVAHHCVGRRELRDDDRVARVVRRTRGRDRGAFGPGFGPQARAAARRPSPVVPERSTSIAVAVTMRPSAASFWSWVIGRSGGVHGRSRSRTLTSHCCASASARSAPTVHCSRGRRENGSNEKSRIAFAWVMASISLRVSGASDGASTSGERGHVESEWG